MKLHFPAAVLSAVFLAACSSSTAPPRPPHTPSAAALPSAAAPPSAAGLAHRISGCTLYPHGGEGLMPPELTDMVCKMPDGEKFEIATFRSSSDEAQWIADGSVPAGPEPGYQGCCVRGNGWAAAIYDPGSNMHWNFLPVLKALGGRRVSG